MASYYVDSDVGGPGSGTIGDPWDDINTNLSSLAAGDTLYLRGGANPAARQDYNETLAVTSGNGCSSGSSGNEITITNFADEYVRLHSVAGVELIDIQLDYWVIEGQSFTVADGDPYFEVDRQNASDYAVHIRLGASNNTLRHLHIHDSDYNPSLVRIQNGSDNLVSYCRIHDNAPDPGTDHHGVYISSNDVGTPADDNIIEYCYIYDVAGDCIQQQIAGTGTISGTIIRYCTLAAHSTPAASENAIDDKSGDGTTIHNCVMYGFRDCDGTVGGSGSDGQAILIQGGAQNAEIYDNEIYDISGAAVVISDDNAVFRNNIIHSLVDEAAISEQSIIYVTGGAQNVDVHNNTVSGSYEGAGNSIRTLAGSTVDLQNNIFYDCHNVNDAGTTNADYNCWYSCTQTIGNGNDITDDPLFVDAANDDYNLTALSPCIDAGVDLGYSYNGTAPDMGALETGGAITPAPATAVVMTIDPTVIGAEGLVIGPSPASAIGVTVGPTVAGRPGYIVLTGYVVVSG